jgi:hypothetical protein
VFTIDDYWNIFKKLKGEDIELDPNIESLIKSEKELVSSFFSSTVDQIAFNTESYQKLKTFLVDWYTAHRTLITIEKNVNDIYFLPENNLNELIRSFGFDFDLSVLNRTTKINMLLDLCNLYKSKGTPQSLYKILNYYGYSGIDIVEYWLKFDNYGDLILQPTIVYPLPPNQKGKRLEPLNYKTFLELNDPHWMYSRIEILRKHQTSAIKLPSLTPYFGLYYNVYLNKLSMAIAIINRYCQNNFMTWYNTGVKPTKDIRISSTWKYVSLLELYLGCIFTFINVFKDQSFGMPYNLEENSNQAIYADTPSDVLVYTERGDSNYDYNILFYTGDQTNVNNILLETDPIYKRSFTRLEKKTKYNLFMNKLVYDQNLKFFQSTNEIEEYLTALNPVFKQTIDDILGTEGETKFLIGLLKDLSNWIKTNIGYDYASIDELVTSLLQDVEMKKIINFFKPYRARIIELKQFFPFDMEEVIPEDYCKEPDVMEMFFDWDTASGKPCCQEEELLCGEDSTGTNFYSRETYDCGNLYDRGAGDDIEILIPIIIEEIPDVLFCMGSDEECRFDGGYSLDSTGDINIAFQSNGFSDYDCEGFYDCPTGYDLFYVFVQNA